MGFIETDIHNLIFNPFDKIGREWMLVTAGSEENCNTMTASWGGLGVLWGKNVATVYIRPQRYTKEFIDSNETFTLSFFDGKYRDALAYAGRVSGKDAPDKIRNTGLTPVCTGDTMAFEEAAMIFVCRKLYKGEIHPENFVDQTLDKANYPDRDYHFVYIAEIEKVLVKK